MSAKTIAIKTRSLALGSVLFGSTALLPLAVLSPIPLSAAEWSWTWTPADGDPLPTATICTFKYGKTWAYAIEIDDGPKWVRSFAMPFLAEYHYTDSPPGVPGGTKRPFVGSAAIIAGATGNNDSLLDWNDLNALLGSGWGVMNHSFDHRANSWSGPSALLSDPQAHEDAFWSQAAFAAHLSDGRAPSGAVYANGYTDYNRNNAMAACGITIATRVGGNSPRDILSPKINWMDFPRSYLDESVWSNEWNKSQSMADFPGADKDGPATNNLVIDFTHEIQRAPNSANQERWRTRLKAIEQRWGAQGTDTLWCAPTAEVADYVRAAQTAKIALIPGKLTISLPENIPGSSLTLRISGIGAKAATQAPAGGALYRQGENVVLTSPRIGPWGSPPPAPKLKRIYEGPAISVDFSEPAIIAGVTLRVFGNPTSATPYRVAVRTSSGDKVFAQRAIGPGWVAGGHLCPILPTAPPITGMGIVITDAEPLKNMTVWALDEGRPSPIVNKAKTTPHLP